MKSDYPPPQMVLAATDLTESAVKALRTAELLAGRFNAQLDVMHVYRTTSLDELAAAATNTDARGMNQREAKDRLELQLDAELAAPAAARATLRESDEPASAVVEYARARTAELIVCGARPRGKLARTLLGSVSEALVDGAPCPVLVVPSVAETRVALPTRIVVAVDPESPRVGLVRAATTWSQALRVPMSVFSVVAQHDLEATAREQLSTTCLPIADHAAVEIAVDDDPSQSIAARMDREDGTACLVIGSDKESHSPFALTSTTQQVLRSGHGPVLAIPLRA
jgi:nucleotide-binding universal stress UspA family protein